MEKIIKNLIVIALCFIATITVHAQDIIFLQNGDEIQSLVQKVGSTEIEYKKFSNPQGPTYTILKAEVFMIKYVNGDKDVFKKTESSATQKTQETTIEQTSSDIAQSVPINKTSQQVELPLDSIATDYQYFKKLCNGNDKVMSNFLNKYDTESYEIFHRGEKFRKAGSPLFLSGMGLTIMGIIDYAVRIKQLEYAMIDGKDTDRIVAGMALGITVIVIGQILIITSIPLTSIGGSLKERGKNNYENKYFKGRTTSLNLNIYSNGMSLALTF